MFLFNFPFPQNFHFHKFYFFHYITENRCIELHSPDGIHSCILRASDPQEGLIWFNALHSAMARTTQTALEDANRALASILGELKHIGWLSRRIGSEQVGKILNFLLYIR